ncbi:MAG: hypothetical protein ABI145_19695 [Steroidobacteraceae bacterium]
MQVSAINSDPTFLHSVRETLQGRLEVLKHPIDELAGRTVNGG